MHGYFEIRCRVPKSKATWPAFWLVSRHKWPPEIDIFEFYTNNPKRYSTSLHWGTGDKVQSDTFWHRACRADDFFHIYACQWDKTQVRFFYDNSLIRVSTTGVSELVVPFLVYINNKCDDRDNGQFLPSGTYPNYFDVDYVRAYQKI